MGKTISVHSILKNEYPTLGVSDEIKQMVGDLETGFTMLIWGASGSGKTTFTLGILGKYLAMEHGKVYYNSKEQGEGSAVQKVLQRYNVGEVPDGRYMFGDRDSFKEMIHKIKTTRPRFIMIDSSDYLNLTQEQYKKLVDLCHKGSKRHWKSIIVISWANGDQPKSQHAKSIRYMVDVKVRVHEGTVTADSRFGATEPYVIFKKKGKPQAQGTLFNS